MPRCGVLTYLRPYPLLQRLVQRHPFTQYHEQHHPHISLPLLADGDRLHYLVDAFHLPVDLGRADAHATGVEYGVRAPVDDQAAVGPLLGIVTMGPDPGETLEVGGAIAAAVRIVPETQRHGREGAGADQLAFFADYLFALAIPYLHRHAQARTLQFAAPDRQRRAAQRKAGNDIGAAGDGGQLHVRLDVAVDVIESFRRQRRAS